MAIYMRKETIDGMEMSLSSVLLRKGACIDCGKHGYRIVTEYYGVFDVGEGMMFGYTTRKATDDEVDMMLHQEEQ